MTDLQLRIQLPIAARELEQVFALALERGTDAQTVLMEIVRTGLGQAVWDSTGAFADEARMRVNAILETVHDHQEMIETTARRDAANAVASYYANRN